MVHDSKRPLQSVHERSYIRIYVHMRARIALATTTIVTVFNFVTYDDSNRLIQERMNPPNSMRTVCGLLYE